MTLPKKIRFRKLYNNNNAISHQLVNIASISIFISVVLATVINSVPLSPDTSTLSDITDKKSMALQLSNILIDTPGMAFDGSPCWESVTDDGLGTGTLLNPLSIGFKMNPADLTSNDLRLLSYKKIVTLTDVNYDYLKTDIFGLPSYFDVYIKVDFLVSPPTDFEYGYAKTNNLLVTKTTNVIVYDNEDTEPWDYAYALLQVKIT